MSATSLLITAIIMLGFFVFWAIVYPAELKEALLFQAENNILSACIWIYIACLVVIAMTLSAL